MDSITANDIRWTSDPIPRSEDVDLLLLTEPELLAYAIDQQHDMSWLRKMLHETMRAAAASTAMNRKLSDSNKHLEQQLARFWAEDTDDTRPQLPPPSSTRPEIRPWM